MNEEMILSLAPIVVVFILLYIFIGFLFIMFREEKPRKMDFSKIRIKKNELINYNNAQMKVEYVIQQKQSFLFFKWWWDFVYTDIDNDGMLRHCKDLRFHTKKEAEQYLQKIKKIN